MIDYSDADTVKLGLGEAQEAEHDQREEAREDTIFCTKEDGQWEPYWWSANSDRPRYTFDMTNPVIDIIAGEIEKADFDIKVSPLNAEKDEAEIIDGIVRNIESMSDASDIYADAARGMVMGGIDGWRLTTDYSDDDSFDQEIKVLPLHNFADRVWFDLSSDRVTRSDANHCWVLQAMTKDAYDVKFPEGSGESLSEDRQSDAYYYKAEHVVVCQFYYIKKEDREIVLASNGQTYKAEEFDKLKDDLEAIGLTEIKRRKRQDNVVYTRLFDSGGWLDEEKKTPFAFMPVIPVYGNFRVVENKPTYRGAVRKLKDYQRVYNYAKSREIEEIALAPRDQLALTAAQAEGYEDDLSKRNISGKTVLIYNKDEGAPPPYVINGSQPNPGLMTNSASMQEGLTRAAGFVAANMGESVNNQSGVAIKALQNKGNMGTVKYFSALEKAIGHTGRVIVDAIPRVYDAQRKVRSMKEDGGIEMLEVNKPSNDNGMVTIENDLTTGRYDVSCSAGAAFQNRQEETVNTIIDMAKIDPTVLGLSSDIIYNNIDAPGMSLIAQRYREQLFNAGQIPVDQMTEEEQQKMAQAQQQAQMQGQQPDPMQMAAQAEMMKAQADLQANEVDMASKQSEMQLKIAEEERKRYESQAKIESDQRDQALKAQQAEVDMMAKQSVALKNLADAEAQEIENQSVQQGIDKIAALVRG